MQWQDEAIILSIRKHGENSAVVRVFAQGHGVYAGVVKGASSKANRGILQPGNIVSANWNARLSEQLGMFRIEMAEPVAAHVMNDAMKLAALSSACTLIESAMPERHPYAKLYRQFITFLRDIRSDGDWLEDYIRLELAILAESGFGLDLSQCAATGKTDELTYVSPKSGRAVSREAGEPYKGKLLPLPSFLLSPRKGLAVPSPAQAGEGTRNQRVEGTRNSLSPKGGGLGRGTLYMQETLAGLQLSGYFLEHWLLTPHNRKLPAARRRLVDFFRQAETV